MEIEVFRLGIRTDTYADLVLIDPCKQRTQDSIPERKDGPVIGISLFYDRGMVYPMHGRRDEQNPKEGFKPPGDLQAAV